MTFSWSHRLCFYVADCINFPCVDLGLDLLRKVFPNSKIIKKGNTASNTFLTPHPLPPQQGYGSPVRMTPFSPSPCAWPGSEHPLNAVCSVETSCECLSSEISRDVCLMQLGSSLVQVNFKDYLQLRIKMRLDLFSMQDGGRCLFNGQTDTRT